MRFVDLTPEDIVREWPQRAGHFSEIARMMDGRFDVVDLLVYIRDGKFKAHGLRDEDGAAPLTVLTCMVEYPKRKALVISGLAGSGIHDWLEAAQEGIFNLARRRGAGLIEARGRKAWARLLPGSEAKGRLYLEAEVI